jgi:hypothetical protein
MLVRIFCLRTEFEVSISCMQSRDVSHFIVLFDETHKLGVKEVCCERVNRTEVPLCLY